MFRIAQSRYDGGKEVAMIELTEQQIKAIASLLSKPKHFVTEGGLS
jgi:hypothetical protein